MGGKRGGAGSRVHLAFLLLVGIAGWALVFTALPAGGHWPPVEAAALFLLVVGGARSLGFPLGLDGDAEVSLDSAIFIASSACLGPRAASIGVATLLSLDALARTLVGRGRRRAHPLSVIAHAAYFGGLSGGLMALWSRVFGLAEPGAVDDVWVVPALGGAFLVSHYLVQTVQLRLGGQSLRASIRRNAIGILAEATLLPLATAIVLIWDPRHPVPFALLGGTYLLVNYGFNRLAHLAQDMRRRVVELETLNRTAHALGASLEAPQLVSSLLRETSRALPAASRLEAVVALSGEPSKIERFTFEPATAREGREPATAPSRLWLKSPRAMLLDADEPNVRSRLIVPLVMYGENLGALIAESPSPDAFGSNELRLLEAISGQAAAAVENARLYGLANVDGLTGLYSRRYFDTRVAEEIERARRFDSSFALVMLDLDDFKLINDTLGHVTGDRVLREVAAVAASQLRGVDLAARWGGEELAFLLPRTSLADAHAVAERIREAVSLHRIGDGALRITASIGVAGWAESGVGDPSSLVARADAALYRAKSAGKNRVEIDLISFELTPSLAPVRRRRA